MANICKECADPSWSGQAPIVVPPLPVDGKVIEFDTFDDFPAEGESGFIYVDLENNDFYKWDTTGEQYVAIGGSSAERDYERLNNLPAVNGVTLVGDKSTADLGITDEIDAAVAAEATARGAAISAEATTRAEADLALQTQIDGITSASDVVDVVGTYEDLEDYDTSKLHDNDIIKVLQDETHNDAITYYRWIVDDEAFTYIGLQGPFYTKSETNALLNEKQDELSEGEGITIEDDEIGVDFNVVATNTRVAEEQTRAEEAEQALEDAIPELLDTTGQSTTAGMTQKAITDALASAGGVKVLTTADYNYPTNNPTSVALWLLEPGIYAKESSSVSVRITIANTLSDAGTAIVGKHFMNGSTEEVAIFRAKEDNIAIYRVNVSSGNGNSIGILSYSDIVDNLVTSDAYKVLSANQGKVLKDLIDSLIIKGTGAPTTSTVGTVGKLYEDTTNGKLYQCTAVSGSTYTWTEVGGGGGGPTVVQTTGTSTTDVMSQNATTGMVYAPPASAVLDTIWMSPQNKPTVVPQYSVTLLGNGSGFSGVRSIQIGYSSRAGAYSASIGDSSGENSTNKRTLYSVNLGYYTGTGSDYSVAVGAYSKATERGEFSIGGSNLGTNGYNGTSYRLLTNVHDGINAHDAATKGQLDAAVGNIETVLATLTTGTGV